MQTALVSTENLTKVYKDQVALENFTFEAYPGEIVGIVGSNGAGKTTLFRLLAGLTQPTSGSLSLFGAPDAEGNRLNRQYMSAMVEAPAFISHFTAQENLEYYRIQRGVLDKSRVQRLIELVGLDSAQDKKFKEYSLGMRQRLGIALSLLHQPKLMIFDEPTNGLDPQAIRQIRLLLRRLAHEEGVTVLISSHILSELEQVADRFIFLSQGREVTRLTQEDLAERLRNYYVIESSQAQRVAQVLEESFASSRYEVDEAGQVRVYDLSLSIEDLNQELVQAGVPVAAIYVQKSVLEDIYMDELVHEGQEQRDHA